MSRPTAGGSATVNGVLYQMLCSLLRAVKVYTQAPERSPQDGAFTQAVLILEPRQGGGDVQERRGRSRVVEQIKARPDGGAWSLREVVEEVLPDLYLAWN